MAQFTITVKDEFVPRIRDALQVRLNLDRRPTAQEIEVFIKQYVRGIVVDHEAQLELQAAQDQIHARKRSEEW